MTEPQTIADMSDKLAIEAAPLSGRWTHRNVYDLLRATAATHGDRPALSFQLRGDPKSKAETLTWSQVLEQVTRGANLLRGLGVGPSDVVAFLLPNLPETAITLLSGMTAGIVAPINPLLEPEQIAAILRETGAKVLVTLAPFVKSDLSQKAARAVRNAPQCRTILEVGLARHLSPPLSWVVPLLAPKREPAGQAKVLRYGREAARMRADALEFALQAGQDDVCAYFHTGGTTGAPKVAVHRHQGAIYNGWVAARLLFGSDDVMLCPLPLFHVFAAYPMWMGCVASGAHLVLPTPAGYRGDGVIANFWKLIARWRVTFTATVPTAAAALMQRPVDADVSSLRYAICGSAPLPPELFRRFEEAAGVRILEGYGMTETTCLISCNPPAGARKIGSVGLTMPYTQAMILAPGPDGQMRDCAVDEVGEICVRSPGVIAGYLEPSRNAGLFAAPGVLRTGDLGRIDADGYLWITGRAKDLIIRGGHNIDPAAIEDALLAHPDVAFVGAVGQPDAYAGELPCAYVELRAGAEVDAAALKAFAAERVSERAARPAHVETMPELPKTAVGKVFKPELRRRALERVYAAALADAGIEGAARGVEDARLGLVAEIESPADEDAIAAALGVYARPWRRAARG
jgi:acyl-CoA synthetase (AMP-forming)/AMP-acid ligase II